MSHTLNLKLEERSLWYLCWGKSVGNEYELMHICLPRSCLDDFFWPNRCYLVFLFSSNCLQTLKIQHISKPRAFLNSFEKNSFCLVLFLYALYAKQMRWNGIVSVLQTLHGLSLDNICDTCIIPLLSGKFISTVDAPVDASFKCLWVHLWFYNPTN